VEALDLAARLGMFRHRVLDLDAEAFERRFEQDLSSARSPGEHGAVVGQQRGRRTVAVGGQLERAEDIGGLNRPERIGGEEQPRVLSDEQEERRRGR
jgi:hypothetical protein